MQEQNTADGTQNKASDKQNEPETINTEIITKLSSKITGEFVAMGLVVIGFLYALTAKTPINTVVIIIGVIFLLGPTLMWLEKKRAQNEIKINAEKEQKKQEEANKQEAEHVKIAARKQFLIDTYHADKIIETTESYTYHAVGISNSQRLFIFDDKVFKYDDIVSAELITRGGNETVTTTKKQGGITRAIVGGAIAGGAGAIVGAATAGEKSTTRTVGYERAAAIKIYTNDPLNPTFSRIVGDDTFLRKVYETLLAIIAQNQKQK